MRSTSNLSINAFPLALMGVSLNLFWNCASWGREEPSPSSTQPIALSKNWQTHNAHLSRTRGGSNLKNCSLTLNAPNCFPLLLKGTDYQNLVQRNANTSVPPDNGAVISQIQVRFLNRRGLPIRGRTRPFIIAREFDLRPGNVYNQKLAQLGLRRVEDLDIVRRANITLKPTGKPNQVVMVVNVVERSSFSASLSTDTRSPSALQGPFQPRTVSPGADIDSGFAIGGSAQLRRIGDNQNLAVRLTGGERVLNGELSFTNPWIVGDRQRTGYSVNVFNQRAVQSVFTEGENEVNLPNDREAWVHRLGGGVEFFRPVSTDLTAALGLSYQQVSVRDDVFSSYLAKRDERGNRLTFSDTGQDDLLTLNFRAALERRNDKENPTSGSRLLVGIDQSIPIGEANIVFTRLSANYLQYIPFPLFGFTTGSRTLILNLQAGTMLGDVPGYEAFNLSAGLTRGFGDGGIGTGRSFVEATVQYNFPIAIFSLFKQQVNLNGQLFVDYVSDLNSGGSVLGRPAIVRSKPGDGLGYGFGLNTNTPFGTATLEFAWSDRNENQVIFTLGERF